jgi:hypothetical protein
MNQIIKIGETPLDLDSGTIISTTKRVANIGTLERQSSFTNKLNLPATANNLAAIGMIQGSDNSTKKYIKQLGTVAANGIEIMNAAQFSFESLGERIEVLINSDNAVFYDLIKKTNLREIDLIDLDHLWTKTEMINSIGNTFEDGYIYAIHDSGVQSEFVGVLNCFGIVPSIFVKYLFQKIGETFGYTFYGSIWEESFFEKLLMPMINCKTGARNIEELKCKFISNTPKTYISNPLAFNFNFEDYDLIENTEGGAFVDKWNVTPNGFFYYLQIPGNYRLVLDYDITITEAFPGNGVSAGFQLNVFRTLNGSIDSIDGFPFNTFQTGVAGNHTGQIIVNCAFEDFIETTLNPNTTGSENTNVYAFIEVLNAPGSFANNSLTINSLTFNVEQITDAKVSHYNRLYNIQESLPNWTCGKFVKEISNLFGLIPVVNEFDKTIRLMSFNELNENKSIAKQWQNKIDLTNNPLYTFKIDGYGQINTFEYKPDSTFGFSIEIENESLPKEIDYIKSDFNYSTFSRILNKTFNTIFLDNYNSEFRLTQNFSYDGLLKFNEKPRIAFLFTQNTEVNYASFGETIVTENTNIPFLGFEAQSFQDFNLDWAYLYPTFYQNLFQGITNNILKIELDFRLTEFDIQDFDFSIPIYLENPSGFYYVQEIKDFTSSSESTSVELLRIG